MDVQGDGTGAPASLDVVVDRDASPEALEVAAAEHYGAGDFEATVAAWERIHALQLHRGEHALAARAGAMVALYLLMDSGLMAPVRGWLGRVDRLLADLDETPAHALLAMVRAYERFFCGDLELAAKWASRAVELGERQDVMPAVILGRVVSARMSIFHGRVEEGLEVLDDVAAQLTSGEVDPMTTGIMFCELICATQGLAQYDRAEEWTRAMDAIRSRGDFFGGVNGRCRVHRAEILRLRGSCAEAEDEALRACEELRPWLRREFGWPLTELGTIRLRRGDLGGAEESFVAAHAGGWDPQPGLAQLRLAQGDIAGAKVMIDDALDRPSRIPSKERPPVGGLSRALLLEAQVEIAVAADDIGTAARAADELGQIATKYQSLALRASASLSRGRIAIANSRASEAVEECRGAVDDWCSVGAPFETSVARLVLAQAHEDDGHPELAEVERLAAQAALDQIGAVHLGAETSKAAVHSSSHAETVASSATFRLDGDTRTVEFGGDAALLRDLIGMRYLARLLAEPGREFHVLDLVAVEQGTLVATRRTADSGALKVANDDLGPLLDDEARRSYQRRLAEIEEDIEEAESMGDTGRAELARSDRDFIVAELSRAFGLSGRNRPTGSSAERARGSVTRSVRYAMGRIAEQHPSLSEHLAQTVSTGTYCTYAPDPRVPIQWQT